MPDYAYLNKIIDSKLAMQEDYIPVTQALWETFDSLYGPGEEIKRPVRELKSGKNYVDGALMKTDFFFIDYGKQDLL